MQCEEAQMVLLVLRASLEVPLLLLSGGELGSPLEMVPG